jgi:hypothetical protein
VEEDKVLVNTGKPGGEYMPYAEAAQRGFNDREFYPTSGKAA